MAIKKIGLVLFLVFLLLNITPSTAIQLEELQDTNITKNVESIKDEGKEIKNIITGIQDDANYIDTRLDYAKNNWWKCWKWTEIIEIFLSELPHTSEKIKDESDQLESCVNILKKNAEKLESETDTNKVNTNFHLKAQNMAKNLTKILNSSFEAIEVSNTNELKEGDVIQYISQGKYDRYLFIEKKNNTNDFVVLECGFNNKRFTINNAEFYQGKYIKIITNSNLTAPHITKTAYQIQKNQINTEKTEINQTTETTENLLKAEIVLADTAAASVAVGVIFTLASVKTAATLVGAVVAAILFGIAVTFYVIGGLCAVASIPIITAYKILINQIGDQNCILDENEKDLENFGGYETQDVPFASLMNLTTMFNKPVNGTFNATDADGDGLYVSLDSNPQKGNVTVKGVNFEYIPHKNFTGEDSFTYHVTDVYGHVSNIATVYIKVLENQAPIAYNITLETVLNRKITTLINATDPEGDKITFIMDQKPKNGNITNITGLNFTYNPFKDFKGNDTLTYQVKDQYGLTSHLAWIKIQIKELITLQHLKQI